MQMHYTCRNVFEVLLLIKCCASNAKAYEFVHFHAMQHVTSCNICLSSQGSFFQTSGTILSEFCYGVKCSNYLFGITLFMGAGNSIITTFSLFGSLLLSKVSSLSSLLEEAQSQHPGHLRCHHQMYCSLLH